MTAEEWRAVEGYSNYEISSCGRVLSRAPLFRTSDRTPRILRPGYTTAGYPTVALYRDAIPTTHYVHHLVASAFLGPRPEGLEIRHYDGDPANSTLSNLLYGTTSENAYDRVRHGTHWQVRKTHCKNGHAFTEENTRRSSDGRHRKCKACRAKWQRDYRTRQAFRAAGIRAA